MIRICLLLLLCVVAGVSADAQQVTSITNSVSQLGLTIINVKDYGAVGDTKTDHPTVTISASSNTLTVGTAEFSSSDVGKHISIDGAGATSATGYISSIPVTAAGSGYTTVPTVTLANTGSGAYATPLAQMTVISATVASGGAGCTTGSQTFTLDATTAGGRATTLAQVTGTVSGGALSGALTVATAGNYMILPANTAAVSVTGGGCTTAPTVNASFGVGSIYLAGQGAGYPNGVTASLSGGTATLGAVVVAFPIAPLSTVITGFTNSTHVILQDSAQNTVSGVQQNLVWGHDDTSALTNAVAFANATYGSATGSHRAVIYFPSGDYTITTPPAMLLSNIGVLGDGINLSKVRLDAAFSGSLFSWSDAWVSSAYVNQTMAMSYLKAAPSVRELHIIGNRNSLNNPNAIACFDHCDMLKVEDAQIDTLPGRAIYLGALLNDAAAYTRESHFTNVRMYYDGAPGFAVFDMGSNNVGDTTNTDYLNGIDIYAPFWVGLWIHSPNGAPRGIVADYLRIEGLESTVKTQVGGDLLEIGDPTAAIAVHGVDLRHLVLVDPYQGWAALRVTSSSSAAIPVNNYFDGQISGSANAGRGLQIDFSSSSIFHFPSIGTIDYNVTVGASAGGAIIMTADGNERFYTYNIDSSEANAVQFPLVCAGMNTNTIGSQAVFTCGASNTNAGLTSVVLGSSNNVTASQSFNFGTGNLATNSSNIQQYVFAHQAITSGNVTSFFGTKGADRGRYGWFGQGSQVFAAVGDRQWGWQGIGAASTGATPARLTADSTAAGSANTLNLPNNGAYAFGRVVVDAYDPTNHIACMWYVDGLLARRTANAASTALVGTPTITQSQCDAALNTSALAVTADTTNGGVNFTVTGPAGNNMHVLAVSSMTVEVQ